MKPRTFTSALAVSAALTLFFTLSHAQIVMPFAGNPTTFGYGGDGGPATSTACKLHFPNKLCHDASGNFYFVDQDNYTVRKVSAAGIITSVAGNGSPLLSGSNPTGVPATSLSMDGVHGIAIDATGNIYFCEGSYIRKVTPSGIFLTFAGNGTAGYSGDGGPATAAMIREGSLAFDPAGNLHITSYYNDVVRKISTSGIITTAVGTTAGYSGDGGPATAAKIAGPRDVTFDASGNMYIVDASNDRIRKVSASGIISTIAGTGTSGFSGDGGPATAAKLDDPESVAVDASGNVFIGDGLNQRIRRVSTSGTIMTWVGTGSWIWNGNGLIGPMTTLHSARALDVYSNTLYFSDYSNNVIRKISTIPTPSLMVAMPDNNEPTTLFPNPATSSLTINTGTAIYNTCIISNTLGQVVIREHITATQATFAINELPAGMYYVTLQGDNDTKTLRFIKD